ncbi:hypothetical protein BAUCODRAFT_31191 [Baudoinia panamericana UAMH 10762]|uniref:N-acetyltransferase domain-containing protein n=1 Tax=Baudoinia panamericana (strain UAMH 10762) TaxID=717646 RepID=M2NHT6_BAUPA|nr:uncharacterized protein BAUCODRAFT_31191 [Baudoinia panamericana UAMH 10762]EMC98919.1 hypothetical protein BAUCODRAFT_31191 [Baudoinia panamericana UAMH 10762]
MYDLWRSERLVYRAVEVEDEPFLARIQAQAKSHLNTAPFTPKPLSKEWVKGTREWLHDKSLIEVVICLPVPAEDAPPSEAVSAAGEKPNPIGHVRLEDMSPNNAQHRHSEIAISLLEEFQGKGYGGEAIKWVLRWGFKFCNLHHIAINAFEWNPGAIRLYQRLGFVKQGVKREFFWFGGRYWDLVMLSMLDKEWRELYSKEETQEMIAGMT